MSYYTNLFSNSKVEQHKPVTLAGRLPGSWVSGLGWVRWLAALEARRVNQGQVRQSALGTWGLGHDRDAARARPSRLVRADVAE